MRAHTVPLHSYNILMIFFRHHRRPSPLNVRTDEKKNIKYRTAPARSRGERGRANRQSLPLALARITFQHRFQRPPLRICVCVCICVCVYVRMRACVFVYRLMCAWESAAKQFSRHTTVRHDVPENRPSSPSLFRRQYRPTSTVCYAVSVSRSLWQTARCRPRRITRYPEPPSYWSSRTTRLSRQPVSVRRATTRETLFDHARYRFV